MHELSQLLLNAGPRAMRAIELAVQIADEAAQADIEVACGCMANPGSGWIWWDVRPEHIDDSKEIIQDVQRAVEYLTLRRRIGRSLEQEGFVRILAEGEEVEPVFDRGFGRHENNEGDTLEGVPVDYESAGVASTKEPA